MSTFEHPELIQNINSCLAPFSKSQSVAMQGFSQLARTAMAVCVYMGGGPALMYAAEALKAWDTLVPAA